jgi:amino acid transporter
VTQIALLAFFTATAVVYGFAHGLHGLSGGAFVPTRHTFIAVVPILIYSFVGIELPTSAAEEMVDPRRDIPAAIGRAGIGQLLMYAIPILTVLLVLSPARITSLHGLIDAMATVFTVYGGHVDGHGHVVLTGMGSVIGGGAALAFVWILLASGAAWTMGAGRAQAAACREGAGPRWLGHISERTGVPVNMGLVTGGLSLLIMFVDLSLTSGNGQRYFSAALTVAVALIMLAYLIIFPTFVALRITEPELERPFRVPGGHTTAWLITILATGWSFLATVSLLWPGVLTAHPDTALPAGFIGDRGGFELLVLAPITVLLVLYAALYAWHPMEAAPSPGESAPEVAGAVALLTVDPPNIEH